MTVTGRVLGSLDGMTWGYLMLVLGPSAAIVGWKILEGVGAVLLDIVVEILVVLKDWHEAWVNRDRKPPGPFRRGLARIASAAIWLWDQIIYGGRLNRRVAHVDAAARQARREQLRRVRAAYREAQRVARLAEQQRRFGSRE
jgi:hypothetical protein